MHERAYFIFHSKICKYFYSEFSFRNGESITYISSIAHFGGGSAIKSKIHFAKTFCSFCNSNHSETARSDDKIKIIKNSLDIKIRSPNP